MTFIIFEVVKSVKIVKKPFTFPHPAIRGAPFVQAFQNFVSELLKHPRTIPQNINFLDQNIFSHLTGGGKVKCFLSILTDFTTSKIIKVVVKNVLKCVKIC